MIVIMIMLWYTIHMLATNNPVIMNYNQIMITIMTALFPVHCQKGSWFCLHNQNSISLPLPPPSVPLSLPAKCHCHLTWWIIISVIKPQCPIAAKWMVNYWQNNNHIRTYRCKGISGIITHRQPVNICTCVKRVAGKTTIVQELLKSCSIKQSQHCPF